MELSDITEAQWTHLEALADEVIPHDEFYSASETGFRQFLTQNWHDIIPKRQDQLGALLEGAPLSEHDWFVRVVAESYYSNPENGGNYGGASFRMVGFEYKPPVEIPQELPYLDPVSIDDLQPHYDVIVVGAGGGGGVVSRILTEAGFKVLCVERGAYLQRADVSMDHLRNHRFARYGHNVGPDIESNPRVIVRTDGSETQRRPHEPFYGNVAMGVGGGTRVWGAQSWRFVPNDFRLRSIYGQPEGSSLEDWPFDYETLEPHYAWVEKAIGVAGEEGHRFHGPRSNPYPMPPHEHQLSGRMLAESAAQLGWTAKAPPIAINSRDYDGRGPCGKNSLCVGFACPSNAKGGVHNTMLPKAIATGNLTLITDTRVKAILADGPTRVRGVMLMDDRHNEREITADIVVSSAGAVESARLLMLSGFGNHSDQLGRHLQDHLYTSAMADFDVPLSNGPGPGPTIATCQFSHNNPGIVGGGMMANDFPMLPIHFWSSYRSRAPKPFGIENKRWMREAFHHSQVVMGPTQEIPNPEARVLLDPRVVDSLGIPVARLSGRLHPETLKTGRFMRSKAEEWLKATGGRNIQGYGAETGNYVSVGQHQAGTCRMGNNPATSVTDPDGRVHELENLYVADASLHVSNGGFNPGLTAMALASKVASGIVASYKT